MSDILNMWAIGNYETSHRPRVHKLFTTATFATITAAGYLNGLNDRNEFLASDIVEAWYGTGLHGRFSLSIDSNNVVTMVTLDANVSGSTTAGNLVKFLDNTGTIQDSGIPAANALLTTTNSTDYQQFVGINSVILASVGTWTKTRVAEADYSYVHSAAAETAILGIDITPHLRAAAGRGFELTSVDVIYKIGTLALSAHTLTLDSIAYANNVANAVTSVPLTGTLATATQSNPYVTNVAVTTPAFFNTAVAKYVLELTVNAQATSAYSYYGLNLHFTKSVQ